MKKHWGVLLMGDSLERTDAVYHEYRSRGLTWCGKEFSLIERYTIKRSIWVHRQNAERFAQQCKRCARAMEAP